MKSYLKVLKKYNITTNNYKLYETAFTHSSYSYFADVSSYERLEFLGDAVLDLIITEYLYLNSGEMEGKMSTLRAFYVREESLYEYSVQLGLNDKIILGKSIIKPSQAVVADVLEAFLGAMFIDKGYYFVKKFVLNNIIPLAKNMVDNEVDNKTVLKELMQVKKKKLEYITVNVEGPQHNKRYTIEVRINDVPYGIGESNTKKGAEQIASEKALRKLKKE